MRATKAKTEIRQEQIAQAALRLLAARGWRKVSLTAIARQVGVVTSAIYRHFSGKDEVLDAVLELVGQSFQANIQAAREATTDPVECLHETLLRHLNLITSGVPVPRIILSEDVFTGNARHLKRIRAIYQVYLGEIAALIRAGQKQGLIRPELAAHSLALMWLGLVQSPAVIWLLGQGDFDLEQHCERAWLLFAETIRTTPRNRMLPT